MIKQREVREQDVIEVSDGVAADGVPVEGTFQLVAGADLALCRDETDQGPAVLVACRVGGRRLSSVVWLRPRRWRVRRSFTGLVVDELPAVSDGG